MTKDEKLKRRWLNASRTLSVIVWPCFLWFVVGGLASNVYNNYLNIPHVTYYEIIIKAIILIIIQWAINTRQKWAIWAFYVLIPINILGTFWGWLSLLYMLIYWKEMTKLLKRKIKTRDIKNNPDIIQF